MYTFYRKYFINEKTYARASTHFIIGHPNTLCIEFYVTDIYNLDWA